MLKNTLIMLTALFTAIGIMPVQAEETPEMPLFIVHFSTGEQWNDSLTPQQQPQFKAHANNLNQLRKQNIILFGARYAELGVIFIKAHSLTAAEKIIQADPGVSSGLFNASVEPLNVFYSWRNAPVVRATKKEVESE